MISEIIITDLSKAESYAYGGSDKYKLWISTVDEEDRHKIQRMKKLLNAKGIIHFSQFFLDWYEEVANNYLLKHGEYLGPQKQHINNIISFLEPFVEDDRVYNLGINCFAGVSRSTAIGIIVSVMSGKTPEEAFRYIQSIRPHACPNLKILRLASSRLKQDLAKPVSDWYSSKEIYV